MPQQPSDLSLLTTLSCQVMKQRVVVCATKAAHLAATRHDALQEARDCKALVNLCAPFSAMYMSQEDLQMSFGEFHNAVALNKLCMW